MDRQQPCPSRAEWQQILEGGFSASSRGDGSGHLENCGRCQAVVESLTGGNRTWLDIAAELRQPPPPLPPACRRALEHAPGPAPQPSAAAFPDEGVALTPRRNSVAKGPTMP